MDKLLVNTIGIGLILIIYWFFFGKRHDEVAASDKWEITVEGGYRPDKIKIIAGKPARLTLVRKDSNSCLEEVVFPDYKIRKFLPLNTPVEIVLPVPHPKKADWHCGMNMYFGKIETV